MNDEEKKAINQLKADTNFYDYELKNGNYIYELFKIEVYKKDVDVTLNLIEKLQKEIEEKTTIIMAGAEKVKQLEKDLKKQEVKENYIPKDKIREKIENYQNEIECENSYLEQGIICEEEYKDRVKVYNSYIFILNKLLEEEE